MQSHDQTKSTAVHTVALDLQHWHLTHDSQDICWLGLQVKGEKQNVLKRAVITEFEQIVDYLQENPVTAAVIYSRQATGFIFGADIKEFTQLDDVGQALAYVVHVQALFQRWSQMPFTTVAMIDGMCLGGGCELALACDYRVAARTMHTRIALPEVKLGIIPGWGGSVRLPRLIGVRRALPLLLSGRALAATAAARCGLVDAVVRRGELTQAARYYALCKQLPAAERRSLQRRRSFVDRLLCSWPLRLQVARNAKRQLDSKISPRHYPAPYAIVANWRRYASRGSAAFRAEADSIARLLVHPTSRNLVQVFFLQQQLKAQAKQVNFVASRVHVVGAGVMGGDIAAWCALRGMHVTLQDKSWEQLKPAIMRAQALFKKKLPHKYLRQRAADRLQCDPVGHGIAQADVIIEAIFEDLDAKRKLLQQLESDAANHAIIATNTSSIVLEDLAQSLQDPGRLVGIHFFNPVAKMPLVEVVAGAATHHNVLQQAQAFVGSIKKLPLPVRSCPGFLVNRILMPYLIEAVSMLQQGYAASLIDVAARQRGMPMGPIELADHVGLDICLAVAKNLMHKDDLPKILDQLVTAGCLGKKSGQGFYTYPKSKRRAKRGLKQRVTPVVALLQKKPSEQQQKDIADRLWYRLLNESVACYHEGVVADADLLDAGLIFGCGFPPYTAGPLCFIREQGAAICWQRLQQLEQRYGSGFKASPGWQKLLHMAAEDKA